MLFTMLHYQGKQYGASNMKFVPYIYRLSRKENEYVALVKPRGQEDLNR